MQAGEEIQDSLSYIENHLSEKTETKTHTDGVSLLDGTKKPSMATIGTYVNNPLFERLCNYVETEFQSKPVLEFSRCSLQYGWNVKYKKQDVPCAPCIQRRVTSLPLLSLEIVK